MAEKMAKITSIAQFDSLLKKAQQMASEAGMQKGDIEKAIKAVRNKG